MTEAQLATTPQPRRYFLYCRKSLESEDRQILSIDSQETELRGTFERHPDIRVVGVFKEAFSAKAPGRPIFEEMLSRIERGEAEGIIAWHPDRLARNSMDGGKIIYLLDRNVLQDLKFSTFSFENNPQGKFMLSIIFGYSKYYVDSLSENVKRGNRAKVAQGWRPGPAPLGYRNDKETKTIVPDEDNFKHVQRILRLALTGIHSVRSILRTVTDEWGYRPDPRRRNSRVLAMSSLYKILGNPFYAGHFYWNGKLHKGKHQPMITLDEFQQIQENLGRPGTEKPQRYSFPFTGIIRCGACGLMVTAEHKVNRFGSRYIYYHCTKRNIGARCKEPSVEGKILEGQLVEFLERISITEEMMVELGQAIIAEAEEKPEGSAVAAREDINRELLTLRRQLTTLTDLRVRELIVDDEYLSRRRELEMTIAATEQRSRNVDTSADWFEPAQLLISFRNQAIGWFENGTDDMKRAIVKTVGSNLTLKERKLSAEAKKPFDFRVEEPQFLYKSSFVDHVRTAFESRDPEFLNLILEIRDIKAKVEEAARKEALPSSEACVRGSRRDSRVRGSAPSLRRRTARRRTSLSSSCGSVQLSRR